MGARGVVGCEQATSNLVEHKFTCSARSNGAGTLLATLSLRIGFSKFGGVALEANTALASARFLSHSAMTPT